MRRPYWLIARYGPGGRAGGKGRTGEREGDIAFHLTFASKQLRSIDEEIARRRPDLEVEIGEDSL